MILAVIPSWYLGAERGGGEVWGCGLGAFALVQGHQTPAAPFGHGLSGGALSNCSLVPGLRLECDTELPLSRESPSLSTDSNAVLGIYAQTLKAIN